MTTLLTTDELAEIEEHYAGQRPPNEHDNIHGRTQIDVPGLCDTIRAAWKENERQAARIAELEKGHMQTVRDMIARSMEGDVEMFACKSDEHIIDCLRSLQVAIPTAFHALVHSAISRLTRITELEATLRHWFGCPSCGEHHEGMCQPHEVRTTGNAWFYARMSDAKEREDKMVSELATLRTTMEEVASMAGCDWLTGQLMLAEALELPGEPAKGE